MPAVPFRLRLFGPFEAYRDEIPLPPPRTRRERWLLALLVLRHRRAVSRPWLAETLWPESETEQAQYNLRRSLSDLRGALGPVAGRLHAAPPRSLQFDLTDSDCDLLAFDACITRGDIASLEHAVTLYRGPLLEGCSEEWVLPERIVREQAYLRALETLASSAAEHGEFEKAVGLLRRAAATDPLSESVHRSLIAALAASGNGAAAMQVYRDLRLRLHRDVNAEPSTETKELLRQIQTQEKTLPGMPAEKPRGNLPQSLSPLVGREREIEMVRTFLKQARLVTLTGAGGIGKTRLAVALAQHISHSYEGGTWFVDLASLTSPASVPHAVLAALRIREEPGRPPLETLLSHLPSKPHLLVIDNCEHLLEAGAHLAHALLTGCPSLQILATSQQAFGITEEIAWRVPSLAVPGSNDLLAAKAAESAIASLVSEYPSLHLFTQRAAQVRPGFTVTSNNVDYVVEICRRLDGIPLALELAAARLRAVDIADIAVRLDDRFRLLTQGSRTALPRQQTLRAAMNWSYDLLNAPEKTLLYRLSVFAGGWTLPAAEAVYGEGDVLDLLTQLIDRSLVVREDSPTEVGRYVLLETVRQYARERLEESGEGETVRIRHRDWYLGLAEKAETQFWGETQVIWLARLEREQANLRVALELSADPSIPGSAETGLRLCSALWRYWCARGQYREGCEQMQRALTQDNEDIYPRERAKVLNRRGHLFMEQGDLSTAHPLLKQSLWLFRKIGDRLGIAAALNNLGSLARLNDDLAGARNAYEEALQVVRELGDRPRLAAVLGNLGVIAMNQGDYEAALPLLIEDVAVCRAEGNDYDLALALNNLGLVTSFRDDLPTASRYFQESLALYRKLGGVLGQALCLTGMGMIARKQADYQTGWECYREALQISYRLGGKRHVAEVLEGFATLLTAWGARQAAPSECRDLLTESRRAGIRLWAVAQGLRTEMRIPVSENTRAQHEQRIVEVRAALGEPAFTELWEQGRKMTAEQGVDYVMGEELAALRRRLESFSSGINREAAPRRCPYGSSGP